MLGYRSKKIYKEGKMTDRQRNTLVVGCIIFGILALGSVGTGIIATALGQTGNTARTRTVRSNRTEKAASQQQSSNEIQTKVFEEKERIEKKIQEYENIHLPNWYKLVEALETSDITDSYKYAETAKRQTKEILDDIPDVEWGNTGDKEFDIQCEQLRNKMLEVYTAKYESIVKLIIFIENPDSPEKMTEAIVAVEESADIWEDFIDEVSEVIY